MLEVFLLTLSKAGLLLLFIAIGYILRRHHDLPDQAGKVLSSLLTRIVCPAYTIYNLYENLSMDVLGEKLLLFVAGSVFCVVAILFANVLARLFARNPVEKSSLIYAFSIPNYGYFGYPIAEGVFGSAFLADMIIFAVPLSLVTSTYGYSLFRTGHKTRFREVLFSPLVVSVLLGLIAGLSGVTLPSFMTDGLKSLGDCMSPCSMILAGFMMGKYSLKELVSGVRPYILSAVRLIGIPLVYLVVLLLCGIRGQYFMLVMLVGCLPLGLNLVVFPESMGHEKQASENGKLCFLSYVMALVTLPVAVALCSAIAW